MQRVIAGLACLAFSIASTGGAFSADDTRLQHRSWIRKLDTPGGTLIESLDAIMDHETTRHLVPGGTAAQHRSWIKKRDTSDPANGASL